jgi:hypothetical protein
MGILDEAIREHLELKRQHGADDSELKQLEDDAFGQAGRPGDAQPDPVAEAATEFMSQPDLGGDDAGEEGESKADGEADSGGGAVSDAPGRREPTAGLVDLQEAPDSGKSESEDDDAPEPAADEEQPAGEHDALPGPVPSGPNTEERHAIADQPTEMFDVEEAFGKGGEVIPTEEPAPPDEDLVAEEIAEPRLAPSEPIHEIEPSISDEREESEEDEEFWSEQRLSDELDQALEAPAIDEPEPLEPKSAEHEVVEPTDEHTEVHRIVEPIDEKTEIHQVEKPDEADEGPARKKDADHDALEETPDFLEEAPEDDELWFEQKPPKDFDFDD